MAEQTFKSPGFFEREIEIISRPIVRNNETPVGIVGPAEKGPAFVPITVSSRDEYEKIFGTPDRFRHGSHAIAEYFAQGGRAATFCRVLGTGKSAADKSHKYAGFKVEGSINANNRGVGAVHFIAANHTVDNSEYVTLGVFNDNDSITTNMDIDQNLNDDAVGENPDKNIQLIRAMIFMHKDYYLGIDVITLDTAADDIAATDVNKLFNLVIKDSDNNLIKKYTVSLDPESNNYIAKVLNTDTFSFESHGHLLYAHFPIDETIASTTSTSVALLRGNVNTLNSFGDFNKRYQTPKTPHFISQPFGTKEYDLFKFESLDDGSYASNKYKISIVNLKASNEKSYKYGTFGVQLRDLNDTDDNPVVYEAYSNLSLDPNANNFIARIIGDQKIKLQLDVDSEDEKRLVREGTFPANSSRIRVVVSSDVLRGNVPEEALPFGFRGIPSILTTLSGKDGRASGAVKEDSLLDGIDLGNALFPAANDASNLLGYSVLPPLFYRAKVTKGNMKTNNAFAQTYLGEASTTENVKTYLYWGLMTTKVKSIDNPNEATSTDVSALTHNLVKFLGNAMTSEGPTADAFNNNKFSLAKVAFGHASISGLTNDVLEEFKNAAYVRNADVGNTVTYDADAQTIKMSGTNDPFSEELTGQPLVQRISFAKILSEDIDKFNRFSFMTKFTAPFCGGFDGVNIMNEDDYYFTDRASSNDVGGNASVEGYASGLSGTDNIDPLSVMQGVEGENNIVVSYKNAVKIMTDEMIVTNNVLVIPGIRDSLITDYAMSRVKDYGKAIYLMDIPHYDKSGNRLFNSARGVLGGSPDVDITSANFVARELNSSYAATYFPDVTIADAGDVIATNKRSRRIPSSVVALGALARTDAAGTPWFAPAGFSRGALNNVKSVDVRLSALDRDVLYEARINPIANFPNNQFVIFGQKTTQIARTALDRVNVRRLMIKIKSDIQRIAQGLLFEQNDARTRGRFIKAASETLQRIRVGQGIEDFRVIMDDTNNTEEDVENNRLNGKIIVVPTRAVEFIAMDFVITNSGVEFPA